MNFIENANLDNKKVILRLDLNVTIKDGNIVDDTKIVKSIPTIKYLLNKNCNVLIMSHLGKVKNEIDKRDNSLYIVCERLSKLLEMNIVFVKDTRDERLKSLLNDNRIVMLENTRYEDLPSSLESGCDDALSKFWASLGDVFVNDAFGTTHRRHASNYGISKYLDTYYGFLIEEEVKGLEPIVNNIEHPFVVIMGGAKVDDKVQLIKSLLDKCDYILVGGGIANTFLAASGFNIGESLYSKDYVDEIAGLITQHRDKVIIPSDVVVENNGVINKKTITQVEDTDTIYDIGDETIKTYKDFIRKAETIFVNGTVGLYEDERYKNGTEEILKELSESEEVVIGLNASLSATVLKPKSDEDFICLIMPVQIR
jgi:phosphoglycerate kinase